MESAGDCGEDRYRGGSRALRGAAKGMVKRREGGEMVISTHVEDKPLKENADKDGDPKGGGGGTAAGLATQSSKGICSSIKL